MGYTKTYQVYFLTIFINTIWSYLLWSPVILILLRGSIVNRTYGIHHNLYV